MLALFINYIYNNLDFAYITAFNNSFFSLYKVI